MPLTPASSSPTSAIPAAAAFVTAVTTALEKLIKDESLANELLQQQKDADAREKQNRPKAAATTWSEFIRLQREAYAKLDDKPSLRDFMRQCSEQYKVLSADERTRLAERVEEDTKRFREEMEAYRRDFPQSSSSKGAKRKRDEDPALSPHGKSAKSAKKAKAKRAAARALQSDSEPSSASETN